MGEEIQLRSIDGFALGAYQATAKGDQKGAVVVLQEIFGINSHIRSVVDGYANNGYTAIAPAIFDRVERNVELGYENDDMTAGIELAFQKLDRTLALQDIQAAVDAARLYGQVGIVGYCFGGLLTWLSACKLSGIAAASAYYGGGIASELAQQPACPVIMHFGERDTHIPLTDVQAITESQPDVKVYTYPADHGFNCDQRASWDEQSAQIAERRTLDHFAEHVSNQVSNRV